MTMSLKPAAAAVLALSLLSAGAAHAQKAGDPVPVQGPAIDVPERPTPRAMGIGPEQRAAIERVERYLDDIGTLKARFAQTDNRGGFATGTLYIQRPGRMRLEYDPPTPILMVANGTFLIYRDKELDQTSHILLSNTPFGALLRKDVSLHDAGVMVTEVKRTGEFLHVTVVQSDEVGAGSLTLTFSEDPLRLREWTTVDPQGTVVRVALLAPQRGVALDDSLFKVEEARDEPWID